MQPCCYAKGMEIIISTPAYIFVKKGIDNFVIGYTETPH